MLTCLFKNRGFSENFVPLKHILFLYLAMPKNEVER